MPLDHSKPVFLSNDTATAEIYTLSLHDALPIAHEAVRVLLEHADVRAVLAVDRDPAAERDVAGDRVARDRVAALRRSEEHTSELQSRQYLVCRLLLVKKHIRFCFSTAAIRRSAR